MTLFKRMAYFMIDTAGSGMTITFANFGRHHDFAVGDLVWVNSRCSKVTDWMDSG